MRPADREPPGGGSFDDAGDATRRTRLANERTYLAWWRTGLTAFAVSVGTGKLVPEVSGGSDSWAYTGLGIAFALLGSFAIVYALRRQRNVERAISRGEYAGPDERIVAGLSVIGALAGIVLALVMLFQG